MANVLSIGQITITDLTDARVASCYLQSTGAAPVQTYNEAETVYNPDYTSTRLTISPHWFFGAEDYTSKLTKNNVQYGSSVSGIGYPSGVNYIIYKNLTGNTTAKITATFTGMTDEETNLTASDMTAEFTITCLTSGSQGENGKTYGLNSNGRNIFTDANSDDITLSAYFYDGGTEETTISDDITYTWELISDTTQKLAAVTDKPYQCVITRSQIVSAATVRCTMRYKDGVDYYATIPIYDKTDALTVAIVSTAGDQFTNHDIDTELTAKLYSASGEEDEDGTNYTYTWTLRNKTGTLINWPINTERTATATATAASLTGKTIHVYSSDVATKAIITVSVEKKGATT